MSESMPSWWSLVVFAVAFVVMEPFTYLAHRYVMHRRGLVWHRSHHGKDTGGGPFERNDLFPLMFASLTIAVMAIGAALPAVRVLLPIGAGVTAYGMAYLVVHDVAIHRRVLAAGRGDRLRSMRVVQHLAEAHALHHRFGAEPYGMLMPIVPASIRRRAQSPVAPDVDVDVDVAVGRDVSPTVQDAVRPLSSRSQ